MPLCAIAFSCNVSAKEQASLDAYKEEYFKKGEIIIEQSGKKSMIESITVGGGGM